MSDSSRKRLYLLRIGIPVWARRGAARSAPAGKAAPPEPEGPGRARRGGRRLAGGEPGAAAHDAGAGCTDQQDAPGQAGGALWMALAEEVARCTRCPLHRSRSQTVFGVGRRDASLMVIGEAPGSEEDRQGRPFVGPAGQLLNAMLRSIGFAREEVFIANVLKCRPPSNRDPQPEEAAACSPYLERQIALVQPRVLLAVGRIAAQLLLQTDKPIGRLRGETYRYGERRTPLIVTYHPAYLLRTPAAKAKSWQDLCMIKSLLTEQAPRVH